MSALAFGMPGGWEWLIIGLVGLLLFGRRLPEVGRSLGRGIVEFKRGIKGFEDEIEAESSKPGDQRAVSQTAPPALDQDERAESAETPVGQSSHKPSE